MRGTVVGVRSVSPPPESSIASAYTGADLVGSFATTFCAGMPRDLDVVARYPRPSRLVGSRSPRNTRHERFWLCLEDDA